MRRLAALFLAFVCLPVIHAEALTLKELIELKQAGVSDDVLLALIEVEKPVFAIDHETIKSLKTEGISERVMIAMIKSGRMPAPAAPSPQPDVPVSTVTPQVVVVEHVVDREPLVREVAVPVAVPVYIPVHVASGRRAGPRSVVTHPAATQQQPNLPIHLQPARPKPAEPVYWGWGGKLRPDAWKPAPEPTRRRSGGID